MKKNAVALRAFNHADDRFAKDQVILGLDAGHFDDWSAKGVDLVREATAAEVSAAKSDTTSSAKPRKTRSKGVAADVSTSGDTVTLDLTADA